MSRKIRIEEQLAELQAELLHQFTRAADCRAQAQGLSEQAKRHDAQAQYTRKWIERLQQDLVMIEVAARGK